MKRSRFRSCCIDVPRPRPPRLFPAPRPCRRGGPPGWNNSHCYGKQTSYKRTSVLRPRGHRDEKPGLGLKVTPLKTDFHVHPVCAFHVQLDPNGALDSNGAVQNVSCDEQTISRFFGVGGARGSPNGSDEMKTRNLQREILVVVVVAVVVVFTSRNLLQGENWNLVVPTGQVQFYGSLHRIET